MVHHSQTSELEIDRHVEPLLDTELIAGVKMDSTATAAEQPEPAPGSEPETEALLETNAVEAEAEIAAAGEQVDPETQSEIHAMYRHFLRSYSYVKEANEKFLATLDQALGEEDYVPKQQEAVRNYAQSILFDPLGQQMVYTEYDQEDMADEAQDLTNREAWLDTDALSNEPSSGP